MGAMRRVTACAVAALAAVAGARQDEASSPRFGFSGFEIYKFDPGLRDLSSGDLDGDGLGDLALANPTRSRLEILLRLRPDEPDAELAPDGEGGGNPLRFDARFRMRTWPLERRLLRLFATDLDRDGRADLVWAVEGGELRALTRVGDPEPRPWRVRVDALRSGCRLLAAADVDGDGTDDLLAAGESELAWLAWTADGPGPVRTLDRVGEGLDQVHLADVDGDGVGDLVYVHLDRDAPLRVRLGVGGGAASAGERFGPRFDPELPALRRAALADLDGDGASEVLGVYKLSGRLGVLGFAAGRGGPRLLARTALEPLEGERGFALGDLDGDGGADVVVSDAKAARVQLLTGRPGTQVLHARAFPALIGVAQPRLGDLDGDGRRELVTLSGPERMIGWTRLDAAGGLPFPETLPVDGEPAALEVVDLDADGRDDVAVVATTGEGRKRASALLVWRGGPQGPVGPPTSFPIEELSKQPAALRAADLDRDGRVDLVLYLAGRELPLFLLQREDGSFAPAASTEESPGLGVLEGAGPINVAVADVDGDGLGELLVATENLARAQWFPRAAEGVLQPEVSLQVNGPTADAAIRAAAVLERGAGEARGLVLFDERTRELLLHELAPGAPPRLVERVAVGPLELRGLEPADVDADGRTDLVLLGAREIGVLFAAERAPQPAEEATWEAPRETLYLDRVAVADLDADGAPEVLLSETSKSSLLLLARDGDGLRQALGFRVFERSPLSEQAAQREPRELLPVELSGDGKTDLALLVHDKLIVYLQE